MFLNASSLVRPEVAAPMPSSAGQQACHADAGPAVVPPPARKKVYRDPKDLRDSEIKM
jgi:hypothetical protein